MFSFIIKALKFFLLCGQNLMQLQYNDDWERNIPQKPDVSFDTHILTWFLWKLCMNNYVCNLNAM